ncbi:MAG: 1,4-dihydroxy-2-naphthoate octaprenyltransferase [Bacteroidetes bacterium]|nr:1,4-dihydroxy-2-naphthoate octaprenyltransferase [Bacteroidota bacterium]
MTVRKIFDRNTILLLRIPFSFFLLPIFIFSLSQANTINWINTSVLFIVLHLFIYPASNAYNSYMDKDKGSIGGLKNPPPVTRNLYVASMILDSAGILLSLIIGWQMVLLILTYILVSKAYSWHGIRLKKYGILSWFVVVIFQGAYTYMVVSMTAESNFTLNWFSQKHILCMCIATLLIGGFYPLTQVYQHDEDSERGDLTISYKLGVIGTFIFTALLFIAANAICFYYFNAFYSLKHFIAFNLCLLPVTGYFLYWFVWVLRKSSNADFTHAMRMTFISSLSMIICFSVLLVINHFT